MLLLYPFQKDKKDVYEYSAFCVKNKFLVNFSKLAFSEHWVRAGTNFKRSILLRGKIVSALGS